ncbi:hypothetical protein BGZ97_006492 [Linnemannia gamsii]|uniref:HCP-like protein n=1 Tax=Linnemannia gamsii TaxID=64522 RepID=A0A9P6QU27_9FUNG|nr:hypothetical protein BGZ97_006492 [Linnemannia gamsii]
MLCTEAVTQECVQAIRPVYNTSPVQNAPITATDQGVVHVTIQLDPEGRKIVLWEDVQFALKGAINIRHGTKILSFLRGSDYQALLPLRIVALPSVVLDVLVEDPLVQMDVVNRALLVVQPTPLPMPLSGTQSPSSQSEPRPAPLCDDMVECDFNVYADRTLDMLTVPLLSLDQIKRHTENDELNLSITRPFDCNSSWQSQQNSLEPSDGAINEDIADTIVQAVHCDIRAQKMLAMAFQRGSDGLSQSYELAFKWYLRAAEQGDSFAQLCVGSLLAYGQGVPQDYTKAATWYLMAANQGLAVAQFYLGVMYYEGLGVPQEYSKAIEWYIKAAQQGHPDAMVSLGIVSARGWGVPEDRSKAVEWFSKAADQGNRGGETLLGLAYLHGHGAPRDVELAMEWFLKAASKGYIDGQVLVGAMYAKGLGVVEDSTRAMEWYLKAANRGHVQARKRFEDLKVKGYGVHLVLEEPLPYVK